MELNADKYRVIKSVENSMRPGMNERCPLRLQKERDLSKAIDSRLSPEGNIDNKLRSKYVQMANMNADFKYIDENMIRKFIKSFTRSTLKYAAVWWSHLKNNTSVK